MFESHRVIGTDKSNRVMPALTWSLNTTVRVAPEMLDFTGL